MRDEEEGRTESLPPPAQDITVSTSANCGHFGGGLCQFGGPHAGDLMAVLADGSVRSIGYTVDPTVFKNLCVRNDGQVVDSRALD